MRPNEKIGEEEIQQENEGTIKMRSEEEIQEMKMERENERENGKKNEWAWILVHFGVYSFVEHKRIQDYK